MTGKSDQSPEGRDAQRLDAKHASSGPAKQDAPEHPLSPSISTTIGERQAIAGPVTISRELYDFLMGVGEIEGTSFGDLKTGLRGRFWWRALLGAAWATTNAPTILGEGWIALTADRALYVDQGKETILCDRLPSPITLVIKNPARADGVFLPAADTDELQLPLADREGVSAVTTTNAPVDELREALGGLELTEDGYSLRTPYDGDVDGEGRHIVVGGEVVVTFADSDDGEQLRDALLGIALHPKTTVPIHGDMRAALEAAVVAEREACAKIAGRDVRSKGAIDYGYVPKFQERAWEIAKEIQARNALKGDGL